MLLRNLHLIILCIIFGDFSVFGHPQCLDFEAPFIPKKSLFFCENHKDYTCCTNKRDSELYWKYFNISESFQYQNFQQCSGLLRQLLCTQCNPYSAHIFDSEAKPDNPLRFPGLCSAYCREMFLQCPELVPKLTDDADLISAKNFEEFCGKIQLSDKDYCFPELLANPTLRGELSRSKSSDDGCLCVKKVAEDLSNPTFGAFHKNSTERFFVLEQEGKIWTYSVNTWKRNEEPFLDIRDRVQVSSRLADERGLLGLAFHPNFEENRRFYLYYTGNVSGITQVRISEFHTLNRSSSDGSPFGDPSSERILIEIPKPRNWWNHNGGMLAFGANGMLYAFIGDGGSGGDPFNNAQNRNSLLGSAVRIDVNQRATPQQPYRIPGDNPFLGQRGMKEEIFAYGLRNAWRCSVDRGDYITGEHRGRILCGDVGQDAYEEIDVVTSGGNYGWRAKEGYVCYKKYRSQCRNLTNDILPVYAYPHTVGKSVTGGYVYRGCKNPNYKGLYIYGDYVNGRLFRLKQREGEWENREIHMCTDNLCTNDLTNDYEQNILSFAEDYRGEIYMLVTSRPTISKTLGGIYRLVDPRRRDDPTNCLFSPPI